MLLEEWAIDKIMEQSSFLGRENIQQIVQHSMTLGKQEVTEYFLNLLGTTSLSFIEEYNDKRFKPVQLIGAWMNPIEKKQLIPKPQNIPKPSKKKNKKLKQVGIQVGYNGRLICECMAVDHDLVRNCLECGKIICAFEGDAECPFCGNFSDLVTDNQDFDEAIANKERLLDFDKNSSRDKKVIDVASDFDQSQLYNTWNSAEERALLLKEIQKREAEQKERKNRRIITLDLENKRILAEPKVEHDQLIGNSSGLYRNPNLSKNAPKYIFSNKIENLEITD